MRGYGFSVMFHSKYLGATFLATEHLGRSVAFLSRYPLAKSTSGGGISSRTVLLKFSVIESGNGIGSINEYAIIDELGVLA